MHATVIAGAPIVASQPDFRLPDAITDATFAGSQRVSAEQKFTPEHQTDHIVRLPREVVALAEMRKPASQKEMRTGLYCTDVGVSISVAGKMFVPPAGKSALE